MWEMPLGKMIDKVQPYRATISILSERMQDPRYCDRPLHTLVRGHQSQNEHFHDNDGGRGMKMSASTEGTLREQAVSQFFLQREVLSVAERSGNQQSKNNNMGVPNILGKIRKRIEPSGG